VLTVVGDLPMPLGTFPRRMTVVRLRSGKLVVYSAIALDESEMKELEGFGEPAYLVVPSDIHRMDAKIWKDRYPSMKVLAPAGVRKKVEEVVHVDQTTADFEDPGVSFIVVPGTDEKEAALVVETATGTTLVVSDLIWNVDNRPGIGGFLFKMLGMTGSDPKIPKVVVRKAIKDKAAVRKQLRAWAHINDLNRIIPSHGNIVTRDVPGVLTHLAEALAA
jgi:hypothetical protein